MSGLPPITQEFPDAVYLDCGLILALKPCYLVLSIILYLSLALYLNVLMMQGRILPQRKLISFTKN